MNQYRLTGIPVLTTVSAILTVPTNTLILNTVTDFPTNLVEPIWMKEGYVGQTTDYFVDMNQRDFLPLIMQDTRLNYWVWQEQIIKLLGALNPVQVLLEYRKRLAIPQLISDVIDIQEIDDYLAYETASQALLSIGNQEIGGIYKTEAARLLDINIRMCVKNEIQPLPAKRKAYHRKYAWRSQISGL